MIYYVPQNIEDYCLDFEVCSSLDGRSVAHEAVKRGRLPKDFDKWEIKDDEGWSVAHEAGYWGNLPEDFNKWGIKDNRGWSVAAMCAKWRKLIKNL